MDKKLCLDRKYRWFKINLLGTDRKYRDYIFRGLTQKELRIARKLEKEKGELEAENYILASCVFDLPDIENLLQGVAFKILLEIYKLSGLTEEGLPYKEAADWIESEVGSLEACAIATIPSCTPEYLENADPTSYAKMLIVGKFQYEAIWRQPAEQAFNLQEQSGFTVQRADRSKLKPGQIAQDKINFTWKKGDPLNIDLDNQPRDLFNHDK